MLLALVVVSRTSCPANARRSPAAAHAPCGRRVQRALLGGQIQREAELALAALAWYAFEFALPERNQLDRMAVIGFAIRAHGTVTAFDVGTSIRSIIEKPYAK